MPTCTWIRAVAWLVLGCAAASLAAAPAAASRPGAPYTIDIWETDDGLPQSSVISMVQSRDGYLWLGTLGGLARFDGRHFTVFDENSSPALGSSRIVFLFEDRRTNLWIATDNGGLAVLKQGQLTSVLLGPVAPERRIVGACEDTAGALWFYGANGTLWRCDGDRVNQFLVDGGRPSACRAIIAERDGRVWVGTDARLTALRTPVQPDLRELPVAWDLPVNKLDALCASQAGGYWRLAAGRVEKWATNHLKFDWGAYPWGRTPVAAVCEDRDGGLIVGTLGAGVFWFDRQGQATCLSTNEGLSYNFITSLLVDREGDLWVGTDGGGLDRVKRQLFTVLEPTRGRVVQSVCEDAFGGLWLGCNVIGAGAQGAGFWRDGVVRWFGPEQGLLNASVRSVFVDRSQRVWAGTWGGLFELRQGMFLPVAGTPLVTHEVSAIFQDRAGRLWIGSQNGLACRDGQTWRNFTERDGLSANAVQALAEDAQGALWIGTRGGGLDRLRDGAVTVFRRSATGLPSDEVSALLVDAEGVLWIGTASGLARLQDNQWTRYSKKEGLVSNSVGYLVEDGLGFLWIGSNAGLMRVSKESLNDVARHTATFVAGRAFVRADGLPTSECSAGSQPGGCRTRDGRLWFPTIKGLVSLDPTRLRPNTNPPPVVIESIRIDGEDLDPTGLRAGQFHRVTMPAGKEQLEIRFTSLNLAAPQQARFQYRLEREGRTNAWTEATDSRTAHFPQMTPGHYRFQVQACNEDGVWNEQGAALSVVVEPPFWQTWWFLGVTAAVCLGLIVAGVHYASTQRLMRQVERLKQQEALERERARIARDIHDQLGANLTQMSLLSELVESDKDSPADVEGHARQISQTARETARALDEIVWAANPSNDTLEGLVNYLCKYAQEYLAVAGLSYRLEAPPQLPARVIAPEVRHNVFLAAKEAVTNVVRHARATAVRLRLSLEPGAFTVEIEDNGRGLGGLDPQAAQTRNGLRNMRRRMEDIGGRFELREAPDGGTVARFTVPLGIGLGAGLVDTPGRGGETGA